jgi:hypothetical protein
MRERATVILRHSGATEVTVGDGDPARPRPVQPGFTDAPPGIVPEAADLHGSD